MMIVRERTYLQVSIKLLSSNIFFITLSPISVKVNCGHLKKELFLLDKGDILLRQ